MADVDKEKNNSKNMANKILFIGYVSLMLIVAGCGKSQLDRRDVKESMVTDNVENDSIGHITEIEAKSNHPIYSQLRKELDSTEIYNDSIIYGYWFQPHAAASVNLFLHKNGEFDMKYCDVKIKGTFVLDRHIIRMKPDGDWGEISIDGRLFHKHNGTNFYLTDSKEEVFYLVKGSD
jgi:hypothetical protein